MCKPKLWIILISQIFVFSLCGQLLNRKTIKITRLENDCRRKNVPLAIYFKGVKCDTTSVFVKNSTIVVKENLIDNLQANATVRRCQTREDLDSCEEFYKVKNINYCQLINPDSVVAATSPLAVSYTPKFKCPLKKGVYHAYNFTVNLTPFTVFAVDGWYWKIEINVYSPDGGRLMSCSDIEGYTVLHSRD